MRRRGQSKQKDPKKESAALIAQMVQRCTRIQLIHCSILRCHADSVCFALALQARKKGTANDWVNAVLNDAIRSKFQTRTRRVTIHTFPTLKWHTFLHFFSSSSVSLSVYSQPRSVRQQMLHMAVRRGTNESCAWLACMTLMPPPSLCDDEPRCCETQSPRYV